MTFTYDITAAVGKIRLEIGDHTSGDGVRPTGSNFSDEELTHFYSDEGSSVGRAAARACEVLAREYSRMVDVTVGPRRESLSQAAEAWAKRGAELRQQFGGTSATKGYSAGWIRKDAYGNSEPSDEGPSSTGSSEYGSQTVYIKV